MKDVPMVKKEFECFIFEVNGDLRIDVDCLFKEVSSFLPLDLIQVRTRSRRIPFFGFSSGFALSLRSNNLDTEVSQEDCTYFGVFSYLDIIGSGVDEVNFAIPTMVELDNLGSVLSSESFSLGFSGSKTIFVKERLVKLEFSAVFVLPCSLRDDYIDLPDLKRWDSNTVIGCEDVLTVLGYDLNLESTVSASPEWYLM